MGVCPVAVYCNKTHHANNTPHKITHHAQSKHSTQNYTNNKGHTTHNDYNVIQLQLQQIQLQLQLYKLILIPKYAYCTLNSNSTEIRDVLNLTCGNRSLVNAYPLLRHPFIKWGITIYVFVKSVFSFRFDNDKYTYRTVGLGT
jgi:hypothetical protein